MSFVCSRRGYNTSLILLWCLMDKSIELVSDLLLPAILESRTDLHLDAAGPKHSLRAVIVFPSRNHRKYVLCQSQKKKTTRAAKDLPWSDNQFLGDNRSFHLMIKPWKHTLAYSTVSLSSIHHLKRQISMSLLSWNDSRPQSIFYSLFPTRPSCSFPAYLIFPSPTTQTLSSSSTSASTTPSPPHPSFWPTALTTPTSSSLIFLSLNTFLNTIIVTTSFLSASSLLDNTKVLISPRSFTSTSHILAKSVEPRIPRLNLLHLLHHVPQT